MFSIFATLLEILELWRANFQMDVTYSWEQDKRRLIGRKSKKAMFTIKKKCVKLTIVKGFQKTMTMCI